MSTEDRRARSDRRARPSIGAPTTWMSTIVRLLYEERRHTARRLDEG
jgi:hypothetical protein